MAITHRESNLGSAHTLNTKYEHDQDVTVGVVEKGSQNLGKATCKMRMKVVLGIIEINGQKIYSEDPQNNQRVIDSGEEIRLWVKTKSATYICFYED